MKKIIAGNWKMNCTRDAADALLAELIPLVRKSTNEVIVCVPFTAINRVRKAIKRTNIKLGAQNVAWAQSGAFTGEISASMLVDVGVEYVIIGHSERRQYFGETDATVNARTLTALNAGLKPIICVGETLTEREKGSTNRVLRRQVRATLAQIGETDIARCVIAYEPVWAIGTGRNAQPADALETIKFIRTVVAQLFGSDIAVALPILYGGSMNAENAESLLYYDDINGGLIGGASLKPVDFAKICNFN